MDSNKRRILIETFNGEGYSNPQIIKIGNQKDLDKKFKILLEEYASDEFESEWGSDYNVTFDNKTDQGAIQLIEVDRIKKALIQIKPDINKVVILKESEDINELLLLLEETTEENNFEDDDLAEYALCEAKHILSSHGDNGFYHLEII